MPAVADAAMPAVTVNPDMGLFVIAAPSGGYSCLGFAVAERRIAAIAAWLGTPVAPHIAGTPGAYAELQRLQHLAWERHAATGDRCPAELTPQLVGLEGRRVEVTAHDGERRTFRVGRSTGWLPCHLEISGRASGGPAVMGAPFLAVRVLPDPRR